MRQALTLIIVFSFAVASGNAFPFSVEPNERELHSTILSTARTVVSLLRDKKLDSLAMLVHPKKGLRFAPYGYISKQSNKRFSRGELRTALRDKRIVNWGRYDGTGKPIRLPFREYYQRFIYDRPFDSAQHVTLNEVQRTNYIPNIFDEYPEANFVDHLFIGTEDFAELDWKCLRLIFEEYEGEWFLVHIVHDEWTS